MGNQQSETIKPRWSFNASEYDSGEPEVEIGCCGILSSPQKANGQKEIWRVNLQNNCEELGVQDYPWIKCVLEASQAQQQISRTCYLKEVQQIQFGFEGSLEEGYKAEVVSDQNLQHALEKSILLPGKLFTSIVQSVENTKSNPIKKTLSCSYVGVTVGTMGATMPEHRPRKLLNMVSMVDESMRSLFSAQSRQIDDKQKQDIRLFVKLSELLQRHTNDPNNCLGVIKQRFGQYFIDEYQQSKAEQVSRHLVTFIDLYKLALTDYYKLDKVSAFFNNEEILDDDNLTNLVTSIVFKNDRIYQIVFRAFSEKHAGNQKCFDEYALSSPKVSPSDFNIADEYCLNQRTIEWYMEKLSLEKCIQNVQIEAEHFNPYELCITKLRQLADAKTPMAKLKIMISCASKVSICMKDFYTQNSLEVRKSIVDADQILSIFQFIVVNSKVSGLYTHLEIIQNFANKSEMKAMAGYYYSVIHSALEHITREQSERH